jgi:hypothetical protein
MFFVSIYLYSSFPGVCLDPIAEDRRVNERATALKRVSLDTNTFWADAHQRSAIVLLQDRAQYVGSC